MEHPAHRLIPQRGRDPWSGRCSEGCSGCKGSEPNARLLGRKEPFGFAQGRLRPFARLAGSFIRAKNALFQDDKVARDCADISPPMRGLTGAPRRRSLLQ
jgi:hypothetical protein